jgi:ammonium transporter Rh
MVGVPAINIKEKASYVSDLFSLLGTVILWVYWPSFVAGATPAGTSASELQIVQTILSLAAATVTTFACSVMLSDDGKLRPVDVQNATLAGGVSVGILASTPLTAAGSLLVGSFAGALSTFGFAHVSPFLYEAIQLHDTCGINNLHGMPSLMGAIISAGLPYVFPHITTFDTNTQLMGVGLTLAVTLVTGCFTGWLMKKFGDEVEMASDAYYWEVADDFSKVPETDHIDVDLRKQARKTGMDV